MPFRRFFRALRRIGRRRRRPAIDYYADDMPIEHDPCKYQLLTPFSFSATSRPPQDAETVFKNTAPSIVSVDSIILEEVAPAPPNSPRITSYKLSFIFLEASDLETILEESEDEDEAQGGDEPGQGGAESQDEGDGSDAEPEADEDAEAPETENPEAGPEPELEVEPDVEPEVNTNVNTEIDTGLDPKVDNEVDAQVQPEAELVFELEAEVPETRQPEPELEEQVKPEEAITNEDASARTESPRPLLDHSSIILPDYPPGDLSLGEEHAINMLMKHIARCSSIDFEVVDAVIEPSWLEDQPAMFQEAFQINRHEMYEALEAAALEIKMRLRDIEVLRAAIANVTHVPFSMERHIYPIIQHCQALCGLRDSTISDVLADRH